MLRDLNALHRKRPEACPGGAPYPRTTSLEFLSRCHPQVAAFYHYWDDKRRGRLMPSRADIDPSELKPFLPGIVLVDVLRDPFRLIYRLVGTREAEYRGYDPTGKDVATHLFGSSREEVLRNYDLVIARRSFVYDEDRLVSPARRLQEAGTLLLPLSRDGETVDQVIIYNHFRDI